MKKYQVEWVERHKAFGVEAHSEDEALEKALEKDRDVTMRGGETEIKIYEMEECLDRHCDCRKPDDMDVAHSKMEENL